MKPLNTRFLTVLTTLAFLAFSGLAVAHPCDRAPGHKHCDGEPGSGPIEYTAELISGAFAFRIVGKPLPSAVTVAPTSKGLALLGNVELVMSRNEGDDPPDTWNKVFNTCGELLKKDSVLGFTVDADDWSIEKPGGVRVIFRDVILPAVGGFPGGKVTVQLIGDVWDEFLPPDPVDPGKSNSIRHNLGWFAIYGRTQKGVHPKRGCQPSGSGSFDIYPFDENTHSVLEITATKPPVPE